MAAWLTSRQIFYFPPGSVHIVVVDPGVGTVRRPIAVQIGDHYLVAPDNGVLSPFYDKAEREGLPLKIVHTNKPEYWLDNISDIFHGRDIFSPVGAHLSAGVPIEELGEVIDDPVRIQLPQPKITENRADGEVVLLFNYLGNIISNIHKDDLPEFEDRSKVKIMFNGTTINGLSRTFGERDLGKMIALPDSMGYIMIAIVQGSAVKHFNPELGDKVAMEY